MMLDESPPVTFAEKVYSNTTPLLDGLEKHQKKYLRLLDDIALLLVAQGESDGEMHEYSQKKIRLLVQ